MARDGGPAASVAMSSETELFALVYNSHVLFKQRLFVFFILLIGMNLTSSSVSAHSGGTDKYGCHAGSMGYHCHNAGPDKEYIQHLKFNGMNERADFKVILKRHKDCESLNKLYLRGVSVSKKAIEQEGQDTFLTLVSKSLYKINRHLDVNNNGIACGFLETENFRTPTFLCGTQPAQSAPQLTTNDTYSRCSTSDPAMGGWKIEVIGVVPNAETAVLAAHYKNTPAPSGEQYFIAKLRITNLNQSSAMFPEQKLGTLGTSGRKYTHFGDSCGSSMLDIRAFEPFSPNESRNLNYCWRIISADADGLVLYFERDVYTLDGTSSLTGTKFYRNSKGFSYIGLK